MKHIVFLREQVNADYFTFRGVPLQELGAEPPSGLPSLAYQCIFMDPVDEIVLSCLGRSLMEHYYPHFASREGHCLFGDSLSHWHGLKALLFVSFLPAQPLMKKGPPRGASQ